MMTDPIADMLTRIRNAQMVKKGVIEVPLSNLKHRLAELLAKEGYLEAVEMMDAPKKALRLTLKYVDGLPAIQSVKRESTPGHRMYRKAEELPTVLNGYGIAVVSTSAGLMTNKEAREKGIGGEVICSIY